MLKLLDKHKLDGTEQELLVLTDQQRLWTEFPCRKWHDASCILFHHFCASCVVMGKEKRVVSDLSDEHVEGKQARYDEEVAPMSSCECGQWTIKIHG